MGGSAFAQTTSDGQPGLVCPRMPLQVYLCQREKVKAILKSIFVVVLVPAEAPGKHDYGDIDFLVAEPAVKQHSIPVELLKEKLNAARVLCQSPTIASFAIPYEAPDNSDGSSVEMPESHTQIDISLAGSRTQADWQLLTHSYGDMCQILGISLRSLGLTFLPDGFYARIPEIDGAATSAGNICKHVILLHLSSDSTLVLRYLGLDPTPFFEGFDDEADVFSWISSGKLFDRRIFDKDAAGEIQREWTSKQKNREQQRKRKRLMYQRFIDEWLPAHPEAGLRHKALVRDHVFEEATSFFDKGSEVASRLTAFREADRENLFWLSVKLALPLKDDKLNRAFRALHRWVHFEDRGPKIAASVELDIGAQPAWTNQGLDEDDLIKWIISNWLKVVELEKARVGHGSTLKSVD